MHRKLEEIVSKTKKDLLKRKQEISIEELQVATGPQTGRSFYKAIKNPKQGSIAIIAEIKLASPAEGDLGSKEDIGTRVKQYEKAEADAVSVVTEKHFFKGSPLFVREIKGVVALPVLQKDFIIDRYQLYEAKKAGADAVLLIAGILSERDLIFLVNLAKSLGIEPVVEVNSEEDLKKALKTETKIIAVNARNLDTFEVSIERACGLLKRIPEKFIKLGFSGIHSRVDVGKYEQAGADAVLIGTELMKTNNIERKIKELKNAG